MPFNFLNFPHPHLVIPAKIGNVAEVRKLGNFGEVGEKSRKVEILGNAGCPNWGVPTFPNFHNFPTSSSFPTFPILPRFPNFPTPSDFTRFPQLFLWHIPQLFQYYRAFQNPTISPTAHIWKNRQRLGRLGKFVNAVNLGQLAKKLGNWVKLALPCWISEFYQTAWTFPTSSASLRMILSISPNSPQLLQLPHLEKISNGWGIAKLSKIG